MQYGPTWRPVILGVTIRVTNTGKAAGTPSCTIDASDPSAPTTERTSPP